MLVDNGDGTFTYTPGVAESGVVTFDYMITDGDGDTSVATATITLVDDSTPTAGSASAAVDDDGLGGGNPASVIDDLDTDIGDSGAGIGDESLFVGTLGGSVGGDGAGANGFSFDAGLDGSTDTVGLETVTYSVVGGLLTATITGGARDGVDLFTVEITDAATGAYEVTLLTNVLHAGGPNDEATDAVVTLGYDITDADGSVAVPGSVLTVTFDDDAPTGSVQDEPGLASNDDETATVDPTDIGFATLTAAALFTETSADGADGATTVYSLTVDGAVASGLFDTETGDEVVLTTDGTTVTGSTTGGAVVFTLSVSPTTGDVELTQFRAVDHGADANDHDALAGIAGGAIALVATITDGDGDIATDMVDIGSILGFEDDGPAVTATSVTVDEDGLPAGHGDAAAGDWVDTNADGDGNEATASGTLALDFGEDGAAADELTLSLTSVTTADPAIGAATLTSDGVAVITVWDATTNTFTGHTGDILDPVFTLQVNGDGTYDFTLSRQLDHPSTDADGANDGPELGYEDDLVLNFSASVEDGDGDTASTAFSITIDDDMPVIFTPEDGAIANDVGATGTFDLFTTNPIGADQDGTFVFSGFNDGDLCLCAGGRPLTLNGVDPMYIFGVGTGTLLATTDPDNLDPGAVVYTIVLDPVLGEYTMDILQETIIAGDVIVVDNLSSAPGGGNVLFRGLGADDATNTLDILLSGSDTVNTNSTEIGIGAGQNINGSADIVRIDFVTDLVTETNLGLFPSGFSYSGHETTTTFFQTISNVQGGPSNTTSIDVTAILADNDQDFGIGGALPEAGESFVTITGVVIYDENDVDVTGAVGVGVVFNADGSVSLSGLKEDWSYEITTATDFSAVEVQGVDGETPLKLGIFSIGGSPVEVPLDLNYEVTATDADGDSVVVDITITVDDNAVTTAESAKGNETFVNEQQTNGDDALVSEIVAAQSVEAAQISSSQGHFGQMAALLAGLVGIDHALGNETGFESLSSIEGARTVLDETAEVSYAENIGLDVQFSLDAPAITEQAGLDGLALDFGGSADRYLESEDGLQLDSDAFAAMGDAQYSDLLTDGESLSAEHISNLQNSGLDASLDMLIIDSALPAVNGVFAEGTSEVLLKGQENVIAETADQLGTEFVAAAGATSSNSILLGDSGFAAGFDIPDLALGINITDELQLLQSLTLNAM